MPVPIIMGAIGAISTIGSLVGTLLNIARYIFCWMLFILFAVIIGIQFLGLSEFDVVRWYTGLLGDALTCQPFAEGAPSGPLFR